jgi:hypothetical protein
MIYCLTCTTIYTSIHACRMRPDAEEILHHKFFRDRTKDALVSQLLNQIPSVCYSRNAIVLYY